MTVIAHPASAADAPTPTGARAILDSFYRAVNTADLALLRAVWLDDPLVQLIPPHRPVLHGPTAIAAHYRTLFARGRRLRVHLENRIEIVVGNLVIFTGQEDGTYIAGRDAVPLHQRVTYCCGYETSARRWRLVYGHASMAEPAQLARYQRTCAQVTSSTDVAG